jgi:ribose transport system ATP-binding protein
MTQIDSNVSEVSQINNVLSQPFALEMKGITKRFPGVTALDNVSIEVARAEIVALIGENGAGKSTLIKILGGIHQPDAGSINIDGHPVSIRSVRDAAQHGIGIIHQELNVLDNLDVGSNVFLGREPVFGGPLKLIDRNRMYAETEKYTARLGLNVSPRTPLDQLSIAQQQLVEIARALSLNARILIMDEPTSSLTLSETERLLQVTKDLRSQGVSIIYISHRLSEITELADRVVALRDGKNAGKLSREEINHDRMVKLMVGRDLKDFYVHPESTSGAVSFEIHSLRTQRFPNGGTSLAMRRGEILGLAGLVGSGRSELAEAIFGATPQIAGSVSLDGKPLSIKTPRDAIRQGVYLIPEDRRRVGLITEMSVRENVTLPSLEKYTKSGMIENKSERAAAKTACESLRVKTASLETIAASLSGGNQQKVVLAKWLSLDPKVIIFDEPTRGIDVGAKAEIYQLMRRLADQGIAILMISSDMEEILGVSDRIAVMHEGAIAGILERNQCSEEAIMHLAVGQNNHRVA